MADVYTVNIDVVDMTIPIGNNRMIPIINQPNPALGYAATASAVSLLLKLANYIIYEAGTSNIIDSYNFTEYFPSSGGGGGGTGDKSRYTVEKTTDGTTGEATYKLMQSINGARATAVGDVIGIRGNEMLVQYGNSVIILNTAIADIKEKMDATYNFTTFNELDITTSGKTLKEITDELHALNLPTNTVVTGQLYSDALPFSGNGEAEVMINKPAYWWKCTSLNVAPYSWNAIAGGGSWSGIIMDWTPTYNPATTYETTGSGNAITDASYSNGKVTFTKGSTFLTGHPTITPGTNTTSTATPAVGETFTAIDGITKDANGHVTAVNTKTVTMPTPTKSNVGLSEVTNDKQIKGLSTGTTAGNLVKFGNDGYTVADAGVGIETEFTSNSDAKVPTSKSITTNVAGNAKLTGYSVDTARGNINADSTITDAVEQLEYREETNKNNILLNTNNGVKNIWKLTIPSDLPSGFTITKDADGGYIFNGTTGSSALACSTDIYFGSGDYVLSGCPANGSDESYRLDILRGANTNYCYGEPVVASGFANTSYQCRIRIAPNYTCNNLKFYPMICKKSLYDVDSSYQPYALPNTELTSLAKQNETNIDDNFNRTGFKNLSTVYSGTASAGSFPIQDTPITLPQGDYVLSFDETATTSTGSFNFKDANGNIISGQGGTYTNKAHVVKNFTITSNNVTQFNIYNNAATTISNLMICTKADWEKSQTFAKHAMSNAELTEDVTKLNQASQYNMAGTYDSGTGRATFAALFRLALNALGLDTSVLHHYIVHVYTNTVSPTADLLIMYGTYYHNNSITHATLYSSQLSFYADNTQGTLVVSGGDNTIHASVRYLD